MHTSLFAIIVALGAERPTGTLEPKVHDWSAFSCEASVRVGEVVGQDEPLVIDCEIRCVTGGREVYNGFLSTNRKLPAQIVITSADGMIRRTLLTPTDDGEGHATNWLMLRDGQVVGRRCVIAQPKLVLGEYFVQAIYNHWLIAARPSSLRPPLSDTQTVDDKPYALNNSDNSKMDRPMAVSAPARFTVKGEGNPGKDERSDFPLHLRLSPTLIQGKYGQKVTTQIHMMNQGPKSLEVFDPLLSGFLWPTRAVDLVVVGQDGRDLGNVLTRELGSTVLPTSADWVQLPPGGFVSSPLTLRAGGLSGEYPPGKYSLEFRAHEHLLAGRPDFELPGAAPEAGRMTYREWRRAFPGPEVWRSKKIQFEILPRTGD